MKNKKLFAILTLVCFMFTFIPVAAFAEEDAVAQIEDTTYSSLQGAIDAVTSTTSTTITLLKDTEGAGVKIPSDKNITIDFADHTYTLTSGVGSSGTETNGLQLLKNSTITLKNGTLNVAEAAKDKFYILIQNYADLTLDDMKLDGTNLDKYSSTEGDSYTLSNNSGEVNITDTTIIANNEGSKAFAFDVYNKDGYAAPKVTVSGESVINGNIDVSGINAGELKVESGSFTDLPTAVEYAAEEATIKLAKTTSGAGVVIDKDVTIDFNDYTYTFTEGVGSTNTTTNGFQILSGNTVTLKNGTLEVAEEAKDKFYILIQNYADLTLDDMKLDGTNLDKYSSTEGDSYTLSNNSGEVNITDTTIIANNDGKLAYAFDVCDSASYSEKPVVTVSGESEITGAIEVSEGLAKNLKLESATITLTRNVSASGLIIPEGANVTIDFAGYTYTLTEPVGSTGTESNGFQILKDANVTLKNGTLEVAEANKEDFYILIQNYANLALDNMELDGTNLDKYSDSDQDSYTLSNNSGTVTINNTAIIANDDGKLAYAFDVCDQKDKGYTLPNVNVTGESTIVGDVEISEALKNNLVVSGGTFTDFDPTAYLADGFSVKSDDKGGFVVIENSAPITPSNPPTSSSGGGFSGVYNYPVNIGDVDGADVTLSDSYATKGETVTITVDPDMGKKVDEVIVTDADGDIIPVTKVGDNKYTFVMPAGKVNVSVTTENADYDQRIVLQINNKNIVNNNKTITNDVSPVIVGDRTLVPVRIVTKLLGGTADWDEATRTVTLTIDGKVLKLVIGEEISGYGTGATILNDRTYVPIRYISEMLGAQVEWIAATQQIVIEK